MTLLTISTVADSDDCDALRDGTGFRASVSSTFVACVTNSTEALRRDIGLRYEGVTIAAGDTINSAKITLDVTSEFRDDASLTVFGVAEDNPAMFSALRTPTPAHVSSTTASVAWSESAVGTGDADTPSLVSIIQELIALPGWASGNAMAFMLRAGSSGSNLDIDTRDFINGGTTARLVIDFTAAAGGDPEGHLIGGKLIRGGLLRSGVLN